MGGLGYLLNVNWVLRGKSIRPTDTQAAVIAPTGHKLLPILSVNNAQGSDVMCVVIFLIDVGPPLIILDIEFEGGIGSSGKYYVLLIF